MSIPAVNPRDLIPGTDRVLRHPAVAPLCETINHALLVEIVRAARARCPMPAESCEAALEAVVTDAVQSARSLLLTSRRLINATGIVIHTGLGTAPLSDRARGRMLEAAGATPTGADGLEERTEAAERLLRALTGGEAACITVQNAATYMLLGAALAHGREIVCAARDLIEISHGIRLRDLTEAGGTRIVPVGAANSVHLEDYRRAITPQTVIVLRIWHSNYAATGYVSHVDTQDLARLAHNHGLPLVLNLGAGSLVDLREKALPYSPTIQDGLRQGADLVLASGDKLIGGPQAGITLGRAKLAQQLVAHPVYRAVRPAKLDLAALEGTLASYLSGRAWEEIPTLRLLATPAAALRVRASMLAEYAVARGFKVDAHPDTTMCGGAILPAVTLPTWIITIHSPALSDDLLYQALLTHEVIGRRHNDAVVLDLRSVLPEHDQLIAAAITAAAPGVRADGTETPSGAVEG